MRPYQYRCHDYSLLTPSFKKYIVSPLIRFVPWKIPANVITIISNAFVYVGLFLAFHENEYFPYSRIAVAGCLLMYLLGDHLDGMQAKRTGTGSALGEFCDHYMDAFNTGIVVFTVMTVFKITNPWIVAIVLVTSYLAHLTVFYEQFKTGWLTFEKLGSLEGVLLSGFFIAISTIPSINNLFHFVVFNDLRLIEIIMILSSVGGVLTYITTLKRTPDIKTGFWLFLLFLVITGVCSIFVLNVFQAFVVITLYSSLYIGRIMRGHLIDGVERLPDSVTPVLMILAAVSELFTENLFLVLITYLLAHIAILVFQTFKSLKTFWVWTNPNKII